MQSTHSEFYVITTFLKVFAKTTEKTLQEGRRASTFWFDIHRSNRKNLKSAEPLEAVQTAMLGSGTKECEIQSNRRSDVHTDQGAELPNSTTHDPFGRHYVARRVFLQ